MFPFHIIGIESDNGSEFINEHLLAYCHAHEITFTRSRPENKNDGAHVEQKNWARVRELVWWESEQWEKLETLGQVCTGMCSCGVWTPAGDLHLAIDVKRVW